MPLLLDVFGLGGLPSQKGPATLRTWALAVEFLPLGVVEFLPPVLLTKGGGVYCSPKVPKRIRRMLLDHLASPSRGLHAVSGKRPLFLLFARTRPRSTRGPGALYQRSRRRLIATRRCTSWLRTFMLLQAARPSR